MRSRLVKLTSSSVAALAVMAALTAVTTTEAVAQVRPALTKNVDEPWRTPWETRSQILPNAGGCWVPTDCNNYQEGPSYAVFDLRPVPAGKRWVVESVTAVLVNGYGRTNNIELGYPRGGIVFDGVKWAYAGPYSPGVSFGSAIFSAAVNVSFGPGETPFVRVTASPSLAGYTVIAFSGYLIDAN